MKNNEIVGFFYLGNGFSSTVWEAVVYSDENGIETIRGIREKTPEANDLVTFTNDEYFKVRIELKRLVSVYGLTTPSYEYLNDKYGYEKK